MGTPPLPNTAGCYSCATARKFVPFWLSSAQFCIELSKRWNLWVKGWLSVLSSWDTVNLKKNSVVFLINVDVPILSEHWPDLSLVVGMNTVIMEKVIMVGLENVKFHSS